MHTIEFNGCGVIATYNVMRMLGYIPNLASVTYDIERNHGTLVWGYAGTDPSHPLDYFRSNGIRIRSYFSLNSLENAARNMNYSNQFMMICFWLDRNNLGRGAHFIAVKKQANGTYTCYNHNGSYIPYFSVLSILNIGSLITGYVIN